MCNLCDPKTKYNNCICPPEWKKFDETLDKIKNVSSELLVESLRISTITLCFNLNSEIDTDALTDKYCVKNKGKFYNSFIFNWHTKYQIKRIVSIKIFKNGKVQITGVNTIKSCCYIIRKVYNKLYEFSQNSKLSEIKICMINSDFKISGLLNLYSLCELLNKNNIQSNGNFLNVVYQPIKYPAINTKFVVNSNLSKYNKHVYNYGIKKKFSDTISILIFRSGSIILTGGNNIDEYLITYKYFLDLIKNNINNIII